MTTGITYPLDIKPLTTLRFFAAFWVLLYFFQAKLGFDFAAVSGLVARGNLGVDLFFILSGFILSHVYLSGVEKARHKHLPFLFARIARVWPLHIATFLAMVALWFVGTRAGTEMDPKAFNLADIPAHIFMVHAWSTTEQVGWNFPSWSISAEWAAYLLFPLIAGLVLKIAARPALALVAAAVFLLVSYFGLEWLFGREFTELTAQGGALRILPSFTLGVVLYAVTRNRSLPFAAGWPLVVMSAIWLVATSELRLDSIWAWPGLAGLVVGFAETGRRGEGGWMSSRLGVYLGEISYAMYMTHLIVDIVWFRIMEAIGVIELSTFGARLAAVGGVFLAVIVASVIAYELVERPARNMLRKLGSERLFKPRARTATTPADRMLSSV
jgi:peptidoglycan/LPS O-acetylase OafA/YrhL